MRMRRGGKGWAPVAVLSAAMAVSALVHAQIPFERAVQDLGSPDVSTRLRTVQLLKDAAYAEAAVPLAPLITDSNDDVQLAAIAAELNIFMAEPIATRRKVGLVVEVRTPIAAEAAFSAGPLILGPRQVPPEVFDGLRAACRDDNARVRLEAIYAFGALASEPVGARRRELLRAAGPDVGAMIGAVDPAHRYAALRVLGRVFDVRPGDEPVEPLVGDAVVGALNDKEDAMRAVAMDALGAMRYERAVPGLTELYSYYKRGDMAERTFASLARIAHPTSADLFTNALADRDPVIRRLAVEGIARIGDKARLGAVQGAMATERIDAVLLAERFAEARLADGPIDPLVEALTRAKSREQARGYLSELAAAGRAAVIASRLQDPEPQLRLDLVDSLALSYQPSAASLVKALQNDPDARVAKAVQRALARLQ